MSNLAKIKNELIVDTDKICFVEPFDDGCRINFIGGSSICITKREYDSLLEYVKVRVYVVALEIEERIQLSDPQCFGRTILISTWPTHAKAIAARNELRKFFKGDKERIQVIIQFVDGRR